MKVTGQCPKCGKENPAEGQFCMTCGAAMSEPSPEAPVYQAPPKQTSVSLKNVVLFLVMLILLGVVIVGLITCGGCLAAFGS